jgi:hypothetical protein
MVIGGLSTNNKFVVFGAHSRTPSKTIVPFAHRGKHGVKKGSGKQGIGKGKGRGKGRERASKPRKALISKKVENKKISQLARSKKAKIKQNKAGGKNGRNVKPPKGSKKKLAAAAAATAIVQKELKAEKKAKSKKIEPPKEELKKNAPKPVEEKKEEAKTEEVQTQSNIDEEKTDEDNDSDDEDIEEDEEDGDDDEYIDLSGDQDLSPTLQKYQQCIQTEVERLWRPPVGVHKGTECTISFAVNENGDVESFIISRPSKILIYDLSIIRVAKKFKFDRTLWGKKFTISFRQ